MIVTKRTKEIGKNRRKYGREEEDCKNYRQIDVNNTKRRGEEDHKEARRKREDNCEKEKKETIT